MAIALEAVDLGLLATVLLLIGTLIAVRYTFRRLAAVLDIGIAGFHPFRGVADSIENVVVAGCNRGIADLEHVARDLWHWSSVAIEETVNGLEAFAGAVSRSIVWLKDEYVGAIVQTGTVAVNLAVGNIRRLAEDARDAVRKEVTDRERAVERSAAATLQTARRDMAGLKATILAEPLSAFESLERDVTARVGAALSRAETYADTAVTGLRTLEDRAVAAATATAAGALSSALARVEQEIGSVRADLGAAIAGARSELGQAIHAAAAAAEAEAEHVAAHAAAALDAATLADRQALAAASAAATAALAGAITAGQTALDRVRGELEQAAGAAAGVADRAAGDLGTIEGTLGLAGAAAALAAVPALHALVNTIARESGLDSPECRAKVKGVCGTPAAPWLRLLGGLALAVEFGSVDELLRLVEAVGRGVAGEVQRVA